MNIKVDKVSSRIFNTYPYFNERVIIERPKRDGKRNIGVRSYCATLWAYRELFRYQWLPPEPGQNKITSYIVVLQM